MARPAGHLRGEVVAELARVAHAIAALGGEHGRDSLLRRAPRR